jgi:hypothetical protein
MAIINLSVSNSLHLIQTQSVPRTAIRVQSVLIPFQHVHCSLNVIGVAEPLVISQAAVPSVNLSISVESQLGLVQVSAPQTIDLSVVNTLLLAQNGASVNPQEAFSVLKISQSAKPSRAIEHDLTLVQVAHPTLIVHLSDTQSLTLTSVATYFITDATKGFNIPVPDAVLPTGVQYAVGSLILRLKPPELGNSDRIEFLRIQRETRGGDLEIFSDPVWPIIETLKYTFKNITRQDASNVFNFLEATVGQTTLLLDYEGNTWTGIISTPAPDVKCLSDKNCGSYEVTIEFQGVLE